MNQRVPDFETEDDFLLPASSNLKPLKKSSMGDEDIMELLWQNGQVVMQNQRTITNRKAETTSSRLIDDETTPCNLFMQEDEMVSWLHYTNEDNNLDLYLHNNDIFPITTAGDLSSEPQLQPSPPPPPSITIPLAQSPRPPIAPVKRSENFLHFSRPKNLPESAPASSHTVQSAVVESNDRPVVQAKMCNYAGASSAGREPETYDISASSSPVTGGSGESASVEPSSRKKLPPVVEDRKRKGRDVDDTECYSEDVEFDHQYHDGKKQSRGSTSAKRTRAAEVHNLSERRRRDRINEKMKALQELIPRCNKSDKASMLDEAIEYLKSLQMQVQMMSMGYGMVPMMPFPGTVQRYMPTMATAMGMGMGMGMDQVGMNHRPMVPYPPILPGPTMPNPAAAAAAHLGPRFPVPRFQMGQVPIMGPTRNLQTANHSDPPMNPFPVQMKANQQPRMVPFADPYQQYHGPQTQFPQLQNQTGMSAISSKPSSSNDVKNPEHHSTG